MGTRLAWACDNPSGNGDRRVGSLWGAEVPLNTGKEHQIMTGLKPHTPGRIGRVDGQRLRSVRWGRTFTVYAMAPRPAWYRHLVLLAAGVTALPTEPWGTGAAACVRVTVALWTLATCSKRGREI